MTSLVILTNDKSWEHSVYLDLVENCLSAYELVGSCLSKQNSKSVSGTAPLNPMCAYYKKQMWATVLVYILGVAWRRGSGASWHNVTKTVRAVGQASDRTGERQRVAASWTCALNKLVLSDSRFDSLAESIAFYRVAQKRGQPISSGNILKTPWPNCVEIGELVQYYMLYTVINFFCLKISSRCGAT